MLHDQNHKQQYWGIESIDRDLNDPLHKQVEAGVTHLHHEATADSVEGVGHDTSSSSDGLSHGPLGEEVGGLLVLEQHALGRVVQSEVGATVHNDALQPGNTKA